LIFTAARDIISLHINNVFPYQERWRDCALWNPATGGMPWCQFLQEISWEMRRVIESLHWRDFLFLIQAFI